MTTTNANDAVARNLLDKSYSSPSWGYVRSFSGMTAIGRELFVGHKPGGSPHMVTRDGFVGVYNLDAIEVPLMPAVLELFELNEDEMRVVWFIHPTMEADVIREGVNNYTSQYIRFARAILAGKVHVDDYVTRGLYERGLTPQRTF